MQRGSEPAVKKIKQKIHVERIHEEDKEIIEQAAHLESEIFPDPWSFHEVRSTVKQKHAFCAAAMEGDTLL